MASLHIDVDIVEPEMHETLEIDHIVEVGMGVYLWLKGIAPKDVSSSSPRVSFLFIFNRIRLVVSNTFLLSGRARSEALATTTITRTRRLSTEPSGETTTPTSAATIFSTRTPK